MLEGKSYPDKENTVDQCYNQVLVILFNSCPLLDALIKYSPTRKLNSTFDPS
jgi:hypothetical protein